jgi:short-subunit dehydrogenase
MLFANKVVVVTGASSGIGRALVLRLAEQGATVVAVARREKLLQVLIQQCAETSPNSFYLAGDIADKVFAESVIEQAVEKLGRLDILVNNAGVPLHQPIYTVTTEQAERVMQVNFLACLWMSLKAIPCMLKQGSGTLVNVSSFATIVTPTYETIYAASKSAMNGFSQGLWADLRGSGIHTLLVHPGPIDTEIWQKFSQPSGYQGKLYPPEQVADEIIEAIRKRRYEVVVPKRSVKLIVARWLNFFVPALVRAGVHRMDPVKPAVVERARQQALMDGKK